MSLACEAVIVRREALPRKKCVDCGKTKTVDFFYKNRTRKDGYQTSCGECQTKRNRMRTMKAVMSPEPKVKEATCRGCGKTKSAVAFHRCASSTTGLHHYCKLCARELNAGLRARYRRRNADGPTVKEKACSVCLKVKPASSFQMSRANKSGLHSQCKPCKIERGRKAKMLREEAEAIRKLHTRRFKGDDAALARMKKAA